MLSKTLKILLGIYIVLLLVILLTFSEGFGFFLLIGTGLFTLVTSIFVINKIKKLKNSLASRIFSVVLISLILYLMIILFYGLGNIGIGEKGLVAMFTFPAYLIFLGLSLIIGIILVIINKNQTVQSKPNKILLIILGVVLILLFYGTIMSGMAKLTNAPGFCSMHIEVKSNSFIFVKGMQNSCITNIAIKQKRQDICLNDRCIELVAINNLDLSICNRIQGNPSDCIFGYSIRLLNTEERIKLGIKPEIGPEICDVLEKKEAKEGCLRRFAFELEDIDFCISGNLYSNCYDQLAKVTNNGDETQCDQLNSPAKEECIKHVHAITLRSIASTKST